MNSLKVSYCDPEGIARLFIHFRRSKINGDKYKTMKLNELKAITPEDLTQKRVPRSDRAIQKMYPQDANFQSSSGRYASTFIHKDTPHDATKIVHKVKENDVKKDPYFKYVSALAKNDRISNNPYFPRIYSVKVAKNGHGEAHYKVDMEALMDFDTLSKEELQMLGEKLFFNFDPWVKDMYARLEGKYKEGARELYVAAVLTAMQKAMRHDSISTYIKDPKLKHAMVLLRSLVKEKDVRPDMHAGNVMVRRGPGGPQLVITDPVA